MSGEGWRSLTGRTSAALNGPLLPAVSPPLPTSAGFAEFLALPTSRERAYHEIGHAITSIVLHRALHSVTIKPVPELNALGVCWGRDPSEPAPPRLMFAPREIYADLDDNIVVLLAGPAAATFVTGVAPADQPGAVMDLEEAERLAALRCRHPHEIRSYLAWCRVRAERIVDDHREEIHRLAAALLERSTLTGAEAMELVRQTREEAA